MSLRVAAPEMIAVAVAFCVAAELLGGERPIAATPAAGILLITLAGWLVVGWMTGLFVARRPFDEFSFTQQLAALMRAIVSWPGSCWEPPMPSVRRFAWPSSGSSPAWRSCSCRWRVASARRSTAAGACVANGR